MEFEPISTTRMSSLMVAGGLFACAGLYMMLRPKPQGAAKIELFGLKFESSSAGLLVFIVGSAFLAVTLFVPEKTATRQSLAAEGQHQDTAVSDSKKETPVAGSNAPVSNTLHTKEEEPNGSKETATPLAVGQVASGTISENDFDGTWDSDWYVVDFPPGTIGQHEVKLRLVSGQTTFVKIFNARDELIKEVSTRSGAVYYDLKGQRGDRVYLLVQRNLLTPILRDYEISVELKQAD